MSGRSASAGLVAQLVVTGALVVGALAVVADDGDRVAHDLREALLWLTPPRALLAAGLLTAVVVGASLAFGPRRARPAAPPIRIPVVAALGFVVVAAASFRLLLGRAATEPRVYGDELIYSGIAKSLSLDGVPRFRGEFDLAHSVLYPLVLSPAYRLAADGATAFEAAKAINALVVACAAIPAYLLARRVAGPGASLLVALLVAFEPWTAYASLVMTESVFLLAFTTFVLLFARMLERPTAVRQLVVLAGLAILVGIRPQALALGLAVVAAVAYAAVRERAIRRYAPLLTALAVGAVLAGAVLVATDAGLPGGWSDVVGSVRDPVGLVKWSLWNLAVYELAVGVVPLLLFPLALARLLRSTDASVRATALALGTSAGTLVLSVALVSVSPSGLGVLHERYLFYLTPLVLTGLAGWLQTEERARAGRGVLACLAAGGIALAATLPSDQVARANNVDSPTAVWVAALHESLSSVGVVVLVVGLAAFGASVLVASRSRAGPLLAVATAFVAGVCALDYSGPFSRAQDGQLAWVDRAIPSGGKAAIVHLGYSRPDQPCGPPADVEQQTFVVLTEFFNTHVDRVFHVTEAVERDNLESPAVTIGDGGVVFENGVPFAPAYAVLDSRQPVVGRRLGRLDLVSLGSQYRAGASLTLWQVDPPLRFLVHAQPLPPRADEGSC